jgi:hypothetical protein
MQYIKLLPLLLLAAAWSACSGNPSQQAIAETKPASSEKPYIQQAPTIKVKDPIASMVGYKNFGEDYFELSLEDVGKYTGHVCGGVASGYVLTHKALAKLYPENEVPVRGQISLAASSRIDPLEVATYIVRAREAHGEEKETNICVIDTTLRSQPGSHTVIFKRADTGAMVKAVFNKHKLMDPKKMGSMKSIKAKVMKGTATEEEKVMFAERVQKVVKKVLTAIPEGVITVEKITDYKFPEI